jgi:leader peptidase (prepilin peptidase)/N-methyltransferase
MASFPIEAKYIILLICLCSIHLYTDIKSYRLYTFITFLLYVTGFYYAYASSSLLSGTLSCFVTLFIFALIMAFSKRIYKQEGMGEGDLWLAGSLSLFFSIKFTIIYLQLSFIFGGLYSLFLILLKKRNRYQRLPFAPFLILGFFFTLFFVAIFSPNYL